MDTNKRLKLEDVVTKILEEVPEARNSDEALYTEYLKRLPSPLRELVKYWTISEFMAMRREKGIASLETIGRCRRRIVNTYERDDLKPSEAIGKRRVKEQTEARKYYAGEL